MFSKILVRSALGAAVISAIILPHATFAATAQRLHFSNNWAGYAATADRYASVSGTWTVASSTGTDPWLSADATWVGIGGVHTDDLIQAGTQVIIQDGVPQYSAWYELLPGTQKTAPLTVRPGDRISTTIQEISPNRWTITIANLTTGTTSQTTLSYVSSHSSVEWIVERPLAVSSTSSGYLPLSDFGRVTFERSSAMNTNGVAMTPASSGAEPLLMGDVNGRLYAAPENVQYGSFIVSYLSAANSAQYLASLHDAYSFSTPNTAPPVQFQQVDTRLIIHIIFATTRPQSVI